MWAVLKTAVPETVPGVRINLPPPASFYAASSTDSPAALAEAARANNPDGDVAFPTAPGAGKERCLVYAHPDSEEHQREVEADLREEQQQRPDYLPGRSKRELKGHL